MTYASVRLALQSATVAFALAGIAALAWPARVRVAPHRIAIAPAAPLAGAERPGDDSALVAAIVSGNVFSVSRRPPAVRYDVSGGASDLAPTPSMQAPTSVPLAAPLDVPDDSPVVADGSAVPRLFGIVSDASGMVALLRLDPRTPGARAYHVGERGGPYRVARIDGDSVTLDGPSGRRTLHLTTATPR